MNTDTLIQTKKELAGGSNACVVPCFNLELVQEITENLPDEQKIRAAAAFYGALADPTRLKILYALSKGELCVCDVAHVICLSVSATSHQLRTLRNLNLTANTYVTDVTQTLHLHCAIVIPRCDFHLVKCGYGQAAARFVCRLFDLVVRSNHSHGAVAALAGAPQPR